MDRNTVPEFNSLNLSTTRNSVGQRYAVSYKNHWDPHLKKPRRVYCEYVGSLEDNKAVKVFVPIIAQATRMI